MRIKSRRKRREITKLIGTRDKLKNQTGMTRMIEILARMVDMEAKRKYRRTNTEKDENRKKY